MDNFHKVISLNGNQHLTLLDSDSSVTMIAHSIAQKLNSPIQNCNITLHGFGGGTCKAMGSISCVVQLDDATFPSRVVIVADKYLPEKVLVGRDILDNPAFGMTKQGETLSSA